MITEEEAAGHLGGHRRRIWACALHIRQIRLVSTSAWAQQGRVSIQASHRLQGVAGRGRAASHRLDR